jgi:hypothetical protein
VKARPCSFTLLVALAVASTAAAQSATDAEALFREGKALMKRGALAEACEAFEGSQRIEPSVPALMNLADCREKNHQLVAAWGHFLEAARLTQRDPDRRAVHEAARRRAAALEPRLSRLVVAVPDQSRVDGLVVLRNGVELDPATWNRALPVDGGDYEIVGKAPGREPWSARVTVGAEGDHRSVEVPRFEAVPTTSTVPAPPPASPATPSGAAERAELTGDDAPPTITGRRTIALAVAAGAVLAAGTGAFFAVRSQSLDQDSLDLCPDGVCPPGRSAEAQDLNDRARRSALGANVAFGVAAAAAIGAGVLWLRGAPAAQTDDDELAVYPTLGTVTGVALETRF